MKQSKSAEFGPGPRWLNLFSKPIWIVARSAMLSSW